MSRYPKISIVTPSFNDALWLETTILSIIDQAYPNLEYIVIDGGSTDGSVDIIRKYQDHIAYWVSEKDNGMYHALQKGFERSTGEIMGWINSDDKHHPGSLFTLAQIFSDYNEINWLQGTPNIIDERNRIVYASPRHEIDKFFFYQHRHIRTRNYIQQESTFWRRDLWKKSGAHISQQYKYAGDFELWVRFFQYEKLYNISALLGSFRWSSKEQASLSHYNDYVKETIQILERFPLAGPERRWLKYRRLIEKIETRLVRIGLKIRNKLYSRHASTVNGKVHFDYKSQQFKMR